MWQQGQLTKVRVVDMNSRAGSYMLQGSTQLQLPQAVS
jgi:hypothetical protein